MTCITHKIVGRVCYHKGSGTSLVLENNWASQNITTVSIPQLKGVPTYGGKFGGSVKWYRGCVRQLQTAFAEIEAHGLLDKVIFWGGSWVPRLIRGGSSPSNHSFGTALDINIYQNWLGDTPAAIGKVGSVRELVPVFEKYGFLWGGRWARQDGMHFEIERNMSHAEIDAAIARGPLRSTPAPAAPSVVLGYFDGDNIKAGRLPVEVRNGRSHGEIRRAFELAGVEMMDGRWADGTPALIRK